MPLLVTQAAQACSRPPCRLAPGQLVQYKSRRSVACRTAVRQAVAPPPTQPPPNTLPAPAVLAAALGVAAAVAVAWQQFGSAKRSTTKPAGSEYMGMAGLVRPAQSAASAELDPEYRMALARTRQATAIHRAIGFLNTGSRARAHVEVRRALHQNSMCRAPLLSTQHSKAELAELYRLHLQQAEVPADFGTLLQLRALLDLDFEDAERIEQEVAEQSAFSI
ncbi:hypothetical protein ACK3TF_004891 [Chlorella vulgaris]